MGGLVGRGRLQPVDPWRGGRGESASEDLAPNLRLYSFLLTGRPGTRRGPGRPGRPPGGQSHSGGWCGSPSAWGTGGRRPFFVGRENEERGKKECGAGSPVLRVSFFSFLTSGGGLPAPLARTHSPTHVPTPMKALLSGHPGRRGSAVGRRASAAAETPTPTTPSAPPVFAPRLLAWAGVPAAADGLATSGDGGWLAVSVWHRGGGWVWRAGRGCAGEAVRACAATPSSPSSSTSPEQKKKTPSPP